MEHLSRAMASSLIVACLACQAASSGPVNATSGGASEASDDHSGDSAGVPTTTGSTSVVDTGSSGVSEGSEGSGTGGISTGEAPPGSCGDAVRNLGEDCDLGYGLNSDSGACTQSCKQAQCGDGLLWVGEEQCDAGPDNNDAAYGGCREDCTPGPRCNDGVLQPGDEECDPAVPPTEGQAPCDPNTCHLAARVAFVTAATYTGALGGLAGADEICVAAAKSAGLDNASNFLAWLSDGFAGPLTRFTDAKTDDGYPYARLDGKELATDFKGLTSIGLLRTLDVTEFGEKLPPEQFAWTATNDEGQPYGQQDNCNQWKSQELKYKAQVGLISPGPGGYEDWQAGDLWTSYKLISCFIGEMHLYCFED